MGERAASQAKQPALLTATVGHQGLMRIHIKPLEVVKPDEGHEFIGPSLSTGSTLLNLALSGNPEWGFATGKYYLLVGDSASGKSFLSLTCLAEASRNPTFHNYRFIYDNVEDGILMEINRLFGADVGKRMEPPAKKGEEPVFSETIEEFYYHLDDAVADGRPFIYILDSMDSLQSEAESAKFDQHKKAHRSGKEAPGSYGMDKAKINSTGLRKALRGLRETGSILIIICQTRDAVSTMSWEKKTRAGGRALKFYATAEIWSSVEGQIKKVVRGKPRKIGDKILLQVKKNRVTGKLHKVSTAIYPSYGIDDVGSCVDFLVDEKWWTKSRGVIQPRSLTVNGSREDIIKYCDSHRDELLHAMSSCWDAIEHEKTLDRRPRYT